MNRNIKLLGLVTVILLVIVGAYWLGSSVARAQMGTPPSAPQSADPMTRMAAAVERMAGAMEQMGGMSQGMMGGMMSGMMGSMGTMGQGDMGSMMQQMQGMMEQMQAQMGQMMQSCQSMASGMSGMPGMAGPMGQAQSATPAAPAGQLNEKDLTRTTSGASIDVSVAFMNPLLKPEEINGKLVFKVALDTHSVDLTQFDLTKLATLRTSDGKTVTTGFTWEPQSESSHHRLGLLKVDATLDGKPLITKETKFLELELKNIGTPSRLFKWEGAALGPAK